MTCTNLFVLSGDEELVEDEAIRPEWVDKKDGSFIILTRFRNKADLDNFADLIGQPKLKRLQSSFTPVKVQFPEEINPDNLWQ